tara:strand:- start:1062 stop:1217 length:156 start_codon:yes stop_codon:yes gene_type:complete
MIKYTKLQKERIEKSKRVAEFFTKSDKGKGKKTTLQELKDRKAGRGSKHTK